MAQVRDLSVAQGKALLAQRSDLLILDNRDLTSYRQGHIDGAMMSHDGLLESLMNDGDKQRPVLLYCYQGHSSRDLAGMFCACGYREVYSLTGGYSEWKRADG